MVCLVLIFAETIRSFIVVAFQKVIHPAAPALFLVGAHQRLRSPRRFRAATVSCIRSVVGRPSGVVRAA